MADPRNFILDSDYPMDKVVFIGEYVVPKTSGDYFTVNHNLGTLPLIIGVASNDNWRTTVPLPIESIGLEAWSDDTKILIPNSIGPTYSVKLFGLTVESDNSDFAATSNLAQTYILNTDYDYMKLIMSGDFQFDSTKTKTIQHNLGYIPTVLAWESMDLTEIGMGTMYRSIAFAEYLIGNHPTHPVYESEKKGILVSNTNITFYGVENTKCYYRIYGDAS